MEREVVALACHRPRFFGRMGAELDEDCITDPQAKLALRALKAVVKDTGRSPDSVVIVVQRLRRWMSEGKVTLAEIDDVVEMFDSATTGDEEAVITEVSPVLKRRIEREAVDTVFSAFQKKTDLAAVSAIIARANRVGVQDISIGDRLGSGTLDIIESARHIDSLPTGILELDMELNGGTARGTLAMWLASTGGGKSMGLIQNTSAAALRGLNVAYATLELPRHIVLARIKANLTGLQINDIIADPQGCGAGAKLDAYDATGRFGAIWVKPFTPKATAPRDLFEWVRNIEEETGLTVDVLVIDYADKLKARGIRSHEERDNSYVESGDIYEDIRVWAVEHRKWAWTASQAQRNKEKKNSRKLDTDDVADSLGKVRVVDYCISLNPRDENTQLVYFIAKNRFDRSHQTIGPLVCDFECARMGPVSIPPEFFV